MGDEKRVASGSSPRAEVTSFSRFASRDSAANLPSSRDSSPGDSPSGARRSAFAVRIAGGGSQSDAAMQLTADIFGQATERPHTHEASALGAAISAAVGLGAYADHTQAVAAMTRPGQRFEPIAANVPLYDALYRKVYQRMYQQLAPLYKDIRAITGYPAPPGE